VAIAHYGSKVGGCSFLPCSGTNEVSAAKYLVQSNFQVSTLIIVYRNPQATVIPQKITKQGESRIDHSEPLTVLKVVVVMLKSRTGVIRRVDVNAFHPAGIVGQQRLQSV
jgi:hypothetical protein